MSYFAVIREAGPGRPARTAVSRIDLPAGGPAGSLASRPACEAIRLHCATQAA